MVTSWTGDQNYYTNSKTQPQRAPRVKIFPLLALFTIQMGKIYYSPHRVTFLPDGLVKITIQISLSACDKCFASFELILYLLFKNGWITTYRIIFTYLHLRIYFTVIQLFRSSFFLNSLRKKPPRIFEFQN